MHLVNNLYTNQFLAEVIDVKEATRHGIIQLTIGYTWRWYRPFLYVRIGRYTLHLGWFLSQKTTDDSSWEVEDYG